MQFLKDYGLDNDDIIDLYEIYDENLINIISANEDNIKNIVNILMKYGFDNINEIIIRALHIFVYSPNYIEKKLYVLKDILKGNYIEIVSENLELLG